MTLSKRRRKEKMTPTWRNDLESIFTIDPYFTDSPAKSNAQNAGLFARIPGTNIKDTEKEYTVELAAPGLDKKDFHVDLDHGQLQIRVEKEQEQTDEQQDYTRREYNYTSFCRSFTLPDTVQKEKIKAEYKDGILQVHLPKVPQAKRKPVKQVKVD